jgi:hypothetical protein
MEYPSFLKWHGQAKRNTLEACDAIYSNEIQAIREDEQEGYLDKCCAPGQREKVLLRGIHYI